MKEEESEREMSCHRYRKSTLIRQAARKAGKGVIYVDGW